MFKIITLAALAALVSPAVAKDVLTNGCASLEVVLRMSMDQFGEAAAFVAMQNGHALTITVSPKTGTWSVWAQNTIGAMCLVAMGEGWQPADERVKMIAPPGKPS